MISNPILKVLSTFQKHKVKALLIGGQASIIYGAVEFSKDTDFVLLLDNNNLRKLSLALKALKAQQIYLPPLEKKYLAKGHACHFRAGTKEARGLRIDILSRMRGCAPFSALWRRRRTIKINNQLKIDVLGLTDLVASKKTQRDKDWLMLRRLIEIDILSTTAPSADKIKWWLLECITPELLFQLAGKYPRLAKQCLANRPLLKQALTGNAKKLILRLSAEEKRERKKDKAYWAPLKKALEKLRWRKK